MSARIPGARERARSEVTTAIKDEARRRLAEEGAAKLSLRAVARELGMVSSALYRYFPSRDDLLTALIIDAYDALGAAAEEAHARTRAEDAAPLARWQAVCSAVRAWALAHPHEYALVYGSPVPGYSAPSSTVAPAARVARTLIAVLEDAHASGALRDGSSADPHCGPGPLSAPLAAEILRVTEEFGLRLPESVTAGLLTAWAQLFGLLNFELFGQFDGVVDEGMREAFFAHAVAGLARGAGLVPLLPGE